MSNLDIATPPPSDDEGPLQSAVWLAQDLGIAMPPVPGDWADDVEEFGLGRLFATDEALLDLDSPGSIAAALSTGPLKTGLAFGYVARGQGGRWFYTLSGARLVLHVSLRSQFDAATGAASMREASFAHGMIERFLGYPANYSAATGTASPTEDSVCRIVSYSDDVDGLAVERQATWSLGAGLSPFAPKSEVFTLEREAPLEVERVIWI